MDEPTSPASSPTRSLQRAALLLRTLSSHTRAGWRLSDLATETGLDHATVHRLLAGLVEERLATRVPGTKRYTVGPLAFELGVAAAPYFSLDRLADANLQKLARELKGTVFLNVRSGTETVCVARYEGRRSISALLVEVGTRRPMCVSAGGLAILLALPRAEQKQAERANLASITRFGATRQAAVRRMLQRSRRAGFGLNVDDIIPGVTAVGASIASRTGAPVASVSMATVSADLPEAALAGVVERLRGEAAEMEVLLSQLRY
jgi:DNA-binding IclR family transcriptional regulator